MITFQQALTESVFHLDGKCVRTRGPRGAVYEHSVVWRRNGQTQTWKRSPDKFSIPVKYGMRSYDRITEDYSGSVHAACDCPLLDKEWFSE